jgi:hypothetical protein
MLTFRETSKKLDGIVLSVFDTKQTALGRSIFSVNTTTSLAAALGMLPLTEDILLPHQSIEFIWTKWNKKLLAKSIHYSFLEDNLITIFLEMLSDLEYM